MINLLHSRPTLPIDEPCHIVAQPSLSGELRDVLKMPWVRYALAVMTLVGFGMVFSVSLKSWLQFFWQQLIIYPEQQFDQMQGMVFPEVDVDDFLLDGTKYADIASLREHIAKALRQQRDFRPQTDRAQTVLDLDLPTLQQAIRRHSWVVDARITRLQTGQVLVHFSEETPFALYADSLRQFWLVNAAGEAFVEIARDEVPVFAHLLRLSGQGADGYLPELLQARQELPESFTYLVRADRLRFSGWKLWYRRKNAPGLYYVYLHASNPRALIIRLKELADIEARYQLSQRAVLGYDFRALPKLRVDFPSKN